MTGARMLVVLFLVARAAQAQTAPELYGRVVDSAGAPVAGARIRIEQLGVQAWSDGAGHYRVRAARECSCTAVASRVGYADRSLTVTLANGSITRGDFALAVAAVPLAALRAASEHRDARELNRAAIENTNAATAGDVLATMPAVTVTQTAPSGPQHVSIRGSASGQVLVLLDGMPLNDAVTGAADLSRIRAADIESISVLPGAHSARYGARALAGVVLIRTRGPAGAREISVAAGSLGSRAAGFVWSDRVRAMPWAVGAHVRRVDGTFDFAQDDISGGRSGTRQNADAASIEAHATLDAPFAGGRVRARPAIRSEERGHPGRAYAPTPKARQAARTAQVSGAWHGMVRTLSGAVTMSYTQQRINFSDPLPPFGLPYDDTTRLKELRGDVEIARPGRTASVAFRVGGRVLGTDAATLSSAPRVSRDIHASGSVQWRPAARRWFAHADLRADFDALQRVTYGTYAVTVGFEGPVTAQLSHRTSYAPPSLADLFFSESVGVAANPDLRAERVRGEVEAVLTWRGDAGPAAAGLSISAFTANTQDLIVWEPDYRFIWSPRNTDVRRRGIDISSDIVLGALSLRGWLAHNRTTYQHLDDDVQLAYRPRNTAALTVELNRSRWHARLGAHYLGERNTSATDLNALDGFWTWSAAGSRHFTAFAFSFTASVRAEGLFDTNNSLIFGFPQPRRTIALELSMARGSGGGRDAR